MNRTLEEGITFDLTDEDLKAIETKEDASLSLSELSAEEMQSLNGGYAVKNAAVVV